MKVLRYKAPRQAEIVESETPKASGKTSVAKTLFTQVSAGTEMAFYRGTAPQLNYSGNKYGLWEKAPNNIVYPMKSDDPGVWWMGYAAVGRIVEVAPEEKNLGKGDLVFTWGPHREYQSASSFVKLPEDTNPRHASFLALMRIALNGYWDARVMLLDDVVIFGMGNIGQLLLQMCKLGGAKVVAVDRIASRLELARKLGADAVFNPATDGDAGNFVYERTNGRGADAVIEVTGNVKALPDAIRCAGYNGQVTVLSFYQDVADTLDLGREFHHKRTVVRSSQAGGNNPHLGPLHNPDRQTQHAIELLKLIDLDSLITHQVPFAELPAALEMIDKNPNECLSVVVEYGK